MLGYIKEGEELKKTFQLPTAVDADKAEASFDKGLLIISVPTVESSRSKKIEIKH